MAKLFKYYDDWKTEILTCPKCGWTGTFDEGSTEYYSALMDSSCPACDVSCAPILAVVSYPTTEESEANWEILSNYEKSAVNFRKRFIEKFQATSLKSPAELPDLDGKALTLIWDFIAVDSSDPYGDRFTVILHDQNLIWREVACFEGFHRFGEIAKIFQAKYGSRMADLVPSDRSETWLYGDDFSSTDFVDKVRASIRNNHKNEPPSGG